MQTIIKSNLAASNSNIYGVSNTAGHKTYYLFIRLLVAYFFKP